MNISEAFSSARVHSENKPMYRPHNSAVAAMGLHPLECLKFVECSHLRLECSETNFKGPRRRFYYQVDKLHYQNKKRL